MKQVNELQGVLLEYLELQPLQDHMYYMCTDFQVKVLIDEEPLQNIDIKIIRFKDI